MKTSQNNHDHLRLKILALLGLSSAVLFGCARTEESNGGTGGISAALTNEASGPAQGVRSPGAPGGSGPPGSGSGAVVP